MGSLDGRVAIITGAGRGIGREHALLFAREGAHIVVNDLGGRGDGEGSSDTPAMEVVGEITRAGGQAVANDSDVATADGSDALVDCALGTFGRLDILVNNAGILRDRVLVNMSDEDWDMSLRVNLRGHFMPLRAAAQYWRTQSKAGERVVARVVNTASESGVFANSGQANYAAAKSAVATLTEVAAKELDRYQVRVNAILPRARTRLTADLTPPAKGDQFDKWDPANVSPFVAYLSSTECEFTGQVFLVGGALIQRVAPWSLDPEWVLEGSERWQLSDLVTRVRGMSPPSNEGRRTGLIR